MIVCENITKLISRLESSFDTISDYRKNSINNLTTYISNKIELDKASLVFICTHNSRRSHMCQIWAQTAADYYNIPNIETYSGGTEATAFNPRAVKTFKNAGFKIEKLDDSDNPVYLVQYSDDKEPLKCFSKVYYDKFNPQKEFAAVMTCSDAEKNCPVVFGAEFRQSLKYDDPKEFDNTDLEEPKYTERFEQIGTEMIFLFNKLAKQSR